MNWNDIHEIAITLAELHPQVDPIQVNFVNLRLMVMSLDGFVGNADRCGEKILEAIQQAWIEEQN